MNAFHAAFWAIVVVAALGALTAAIGFPRPARRDSGLQPTMPHGDRRVPEILA